MITVADSSQDLSDVSKHVSVMATLCKDASDRTTAVTTKVWDSLISYKLEIH